MSLNRRKKIKHKYSRYIECEDMESLAPAYIFSEGKSTEDKFSKYKPLSKDTALSNKEILSLEQYIYASMMISSETDSCLFDLFSSIPDDLESMLNKGSNAEKFSDMLGRLIDERQVKDPEVYNAAHIDRRLHSQIMSGQKKASKRNIFAYALALKLDFDTTNILLAKADHAYCDYIVSDIILRYAIEHHCTIDKTNEYLYYKGCPLL